MRYIFFWFSLAMLLTRLPFTSGVLHLLDASWALFFLLGRLKISSGQRLLGFTWFVLLGWLIDLLATQGDLVSAYCMTPAYLGMPIAYVALTAAGFLSSRQLSAHVALIVAQLVFCIALGSALAFIISNWFFYALSGHFVDMSVSDYSLAVVQYYPSYLLTAQLYILVWFCLERYRSRERKTARARATYERSTYE